MIAKAVRNAFPRRTMAPLIPLAASLQLIAGCATYTYVERDIAGSTVAIDSMTPIEKTQWSFLWGLISEGLDPLPDPCRGNGDGRVEVNLAWYSVPLAVLTLGTAIPSKWTVYCCTFRAPTTPPPRGGPPGTP